MVSCWFTAKVNRELGDGGGLSVEWLPNHGDFSPISDMGPLKKAMDSGQSTNF